MPPKKTRAAPKQLNDPWVFVGPLHDSITESALKAHFESVAPVTAVELRFSGALHIRSAETGFRYAAVHFADGSASEAALKLHGTRIWDADNEVERVITVRSQSQNLPIIDGQVALYPDQDSPGKAGLKVVQTASGARKAPEKVAVTELWMPVGGAATTAVPSTSIAEVDEGDGSSNAAEMHQGNVATRRPAKPAKVKHNKFGVPFTMAT